MTFMLKVPTHLDGRNPIVGRYTTRDLVPVVAGAFGAAGVLGQPHLLTPVRIGEALAVVVLGGATGLVRPGGRSLVDWGRRAMTHALGARSSVWTPPAALAVTASPTDTIRPPHLAALPDAGTLTSSLPGAPTPPIPNAPGARHPATHAHPFVPVAIDDDTVTFTDGRHCAVLECGGANVAGMDPEQQRALHTAYHAFLLGLSFPVQVLVCADPVDLGSYVARRATRLAGQPLAVRRLGSADAAYMRRAMARVGALDQHVYVVIPATMSPTAPAPDGAGLLTLLRYRRRPQADGRQRDEASRLLTERCDAIREGLARAGVHTWRLDTPALRVLYYRRLCPRTACLQPFDGGHADPVATARVVFAQPADDAPMDDADDEEDSDGKDNA